MKIFTKNKKGFTLIEHEPSERVRRNAGFTLIELAIAIFIIALLMGALLVPLATQVEQRQIAETQKGMEDIRDALLGFAATNGYLPCPDLQAGAGANDGLEDADAATGLCTVITGSGANQLAAGNIPWGTLGLGNQDAWGNRFRYTVLETYARRPPAANFSLSTSGGLRICTSAACSSTMTTTAVAVIISHGKNGLSAINAATNAANVAATSANELENADNDRDAVSATQSNVAGAEFDDLVVWLAKFSLNNRMVSAGKLP